MNSSFQTESLQRSGDSKFFFLKENVHMMAPHWLDDVFDVPENAATALTATDRFKEAVAKAQAAFYEAQEFQKKNPKIVGGSPAQQARVAFLEAINAN